MPRQKLTAEVNRLVAGLITEASPLTFPENASIDEDNFVLDKDGTRKRRYGIDYETDGEISRLHETDVFGEDVAFSTFVWENAGGIPTKSILVVQMSITLAFYDMDASPLSSGVIYTNRAASANYNKMFDYAVVDGILTVVTGEKAIRNYVYDPGTATISYTTENLLIRDLFGCDFSLPNQPDINTRRGSGLSYRPPYIAESHLYNLRNQTWALPRLVSDVDDPEGTDAETTEDPVLMFADWIDDKNNASAQRKYPSNADSVLTGLYPEPKSEDAPLLDRFHSPAVDTAGLGNVPAPRGYFIIDALERGESREFEASRLDSSLYYKFSGRSPEVFSGPYDEWRIKLDKTPGGPSCTAEFAGRAWYGGFLGEIEDGNDSSPRLSSYLLFSQIVESPDNTYRCYQEGDPTAKDNNELLPTDGGFLRVSGAYDITALVDIGTSLVVLARNGVWAITGGNDFGFDATNFIVNKVTDHGCVGRGSVVEVDSTIFYWGDDGIYHFAPNKVGDMAVENITTNTIQSLYDDIGFKDKQFADGIYDSYQRKVRWVYGNRASSEENRELILDMALGAFSTATIGKVSDDWPLVLSPFEVKPYTIGDVTNPVEYDDETVTYDGDDVNYITDGISNAQREVFYVARIGSREGDESTPFQFSVYKDTDFLDWVGTGTGGVDAPAHVITGYSPGQDFQRNKQVPYVTFHLNKTETGFTEVDGDIVPVGESSCLVQAQWNWTNSANSNRWGRQFQAYRHNRLYMPSGSGSSYADGHSLVTTKNKLRGKGKVLSLLIQSEPGKDLQLVGISSMLEVAGNV